MLIRVIYKDGKYDMVKPVLLNSLLSENRIEKFQRSQGWAVIGKDKIRISRGQPYSGPERRSPLNA